MKSLPITIARGVITKVLLPLIAVGVALTIVAVAPGVIQVVDMFGKKWRFPQKHFRRSLKRWERNGFIHKRRKTDWDFVLTKKGKELLKERVIEELTIRKPKRWDGQWRLVIFDIPEKYSEARNLLRWKLKNLGFRYVNLSVWAFPYECRDEINAVAAYYNVGRYVRYARTKFFDGALEMEKHFALS
ncbi:MAG: hypothetical protein HY459_01270 [Parcubacteria group bacterium]|nr:hypothetical protein [Parcubacteria group bacterium]